MLEDDNEASEFFEVAVTPPDFSAAPSIDVSTATGVVSATRVDITLLDGYHFLIEGSTSRMAVVGLYQGLTA